MYDFVVGIPALLALLTEIGASHPLDTQFISGGVTLKAQPTKTPDELNLEACTDHPVVVIAWYQHTTRFARSVRY